MRKVAEARALAQARSIRRCSVARPRAASQQSNGLLARPQVETTVGTRDQTFETISALLTKPLPGYGELFRMLSFDQVGPAAMLSRATGGLIGRTVLLTMPGSPAAVRLAMEKLIAPELGHLLREARK